MFLRFRVAESALCLVALAAAWLVAAVDVQAADPSPKSVAHQVKDQAESAVDIAVFGQVVTSDPKRMTGTAATRIQEFPAADIALETELRPAAAGGYTVPAAADGRGCIGLRWHEMRFLRRLELDWGKGVTPPPAGAVRLQYWVGESPWQGEWKPLPAKLEQSPTVWSWQIADQDQPAGTVRVRWVFAASKAPVVLKRLSAYSRVSWKTAKLLVEVQSPTGTDSARIDVYNGLLLGATKKDVVTTKPWNPLQPTALKVRYSKPGTQKVDRTVLRFQLPEPSVCVAVEDVVAHGCVYVPSAGLFVTTDPPRMTLEQHLQEIADKKTVLDEVRQLPDQEFSRAMATTHNPIQNQGPMLVSLSCDNRKFNVGRDGSISFLLYDAPDGTYPAPNFQPSTYRLRPNFGDDKGQVSRHLDGGWLPKPVTTVVDGGVTYRQCTYVAPIDDVAPDGCPAWYRPRAVCVAEYAIENTSTADADASVQLTFLKPDNKPLAADELQQDGNGWIAVCQQRLLAKFDASASAPLTLVRGGDGLVLKGKLAAGKSARLVVYLPAWPVKPAEAAIFDDAKPAARTQKYWNDQFRGVMQVEVPDQMLSNVIRASQVHCLLAARNEERGKFVAPWIASVDYGPLESESQAVIRGMDMCGHADFARRGLEFFLKRYNDQGFLTTGYTLIGTGEHLWTLGEHYARQGDQEWLKKAAPTLARACKWIVAQRAKTKRKDINGQRVPEYGMVPPGVSADWNRFAYRFFNDIQYCRGLETAAQALAQIGHPDATALLADAKNYREDLMRAYHWTQARSPVVLLANGTWVPNHPAILDCFGNVEEFVPSEDSNRTWCYSVEIGAHHMAANRLMDPKSNEVTRMMNYLEDHQFLRSGWFDYPEEQNRKDIFSFGGFAKVQPYYARNAEVYALRDDVKPFVRSYFNALSAMLSAENLSLWEHFHSSGAFNKTHETGWFLCQTAMMFAMDRGDELWLAPMVTDRWLQDGMKVAVRNAPTRFGNVSYTITSSAANGFIDAEIQPPTTRTMPRLLVIRLRHPDGKPIKAVTVNGAPHEDFDPRNGCINIAPSAGPVKLHVKY
jgi:hypothetical protein